MENSAESSGKSCNYRRFDDLVRSERYFTATLLPILLFHNNMEGVRQFVELVDRKAKTERDSSGEPMREKGTPEYNHFEDVEVITEFHIARDLKFAGLPQPELLRRGLRPAWPPSGAGHPGWRSHASDCRPERGGSSLFGPFRGFWSSSGWRPSRP